MLISRLEFFKNLVTNAIFAIWYKLLVNTWSPGILPLLSQ